jgi:hypothetical protein
MLSDTHPEVEKLQIELMRQLSPAEKFARVQAMTSWVLSLSRRAIAAANPDLTPEELRLKIIEHHYGKDMAEHVRMHFKEQ